MVEELRRDGFEHASTGTRTPRIAFGSWAFAFGPFERDPWSFEQVLDWVSSLGYDGVEVNGFRPHPHDQDYDSGDAAMRLRDAIERRGLGVSAFAPDLTSVPPTEVPEEYLRRIDSCIRFCSRIGTGLLRVDSVAAPGTRGASEYSRLRRRLVDVWREAAGRCQDAGIRLVWEFEPGFWLNRPTEIADVLAEVDHDAFGVLFDTSHAYACAVAAARQPAPTEALPGGDVELAAMLRPWVRHLHLIDGDGSLHDDETSAHLPFGTGAVDFVAVMEALRPRAAELPWWTVDCCFSPTTESDGVDGLPVVRGLRARTMAEGVVR